MFDNVDVDWLADGVLVLVGDADGCFAFGGAFGHADLDCAGGGVDFDLGASDRLVVFVGDGAEEALGGVSHLVIKGDRFIVRLDRVNTVTRRHRRCWGNGHLDWVADGVVVLVVDLDFGEAFGGFFGQGDGDLTGGGITPAKLMGQNLPNNE